MKITPRNIYALVAQSNSLVKKRACFSLAYVEKGLHLRKSIADVISNTSLTSHQLSLFIDCESQLAKKTRLAKIAVIFIKLFGCKQSKEKLRKIDRVTKDCNATINKIYRIIELGLRPTEKLKLEKLLFDEDHLYHQFKFYGFKLRVSGELHLPVMEVTPLAEEFIEDSVAEDFLSQVDDIYEELRKSRASLELHHTKEGLRDERLALKNMSNEKFRQIVMGCDLKGNKITLDQISVIKPLILRKAVPIARLLGNKVVNEDKLRELFERLRRGHGILLKVHDQYSLGEYELQELTKVKEIPEVNCREITFSRFKKIVLDINGAPRASRVAVFHDDLHTLAELADIGIITEDKKHQYYLSSEYQFLQEGLVNYPSSDWKRLRPVMYMKSPPTIPTLEIISHIPSHTAAGVFYGQPGHTSIKITDVNGAVYSVGIYPLDRENSFNKLSQRPAELVSPDPFLLMPEKSLRNYTLCFRLSQKALHRVINWIERVKEKHSGSGNGKQSNLFYHATEQNCAHFGAAVRTLCIKLGAKQIFKAKVRYKDRLHFAIEKKILQYSLKIPSIRKRYHYSKGHISFSRARKMLFPLDFFT